METLFEVKKIWKGTSSSQVIVYTSFSSCTFRFAEGGVSSFSSYIGEEKLETSMCSGTKRLDEAEMDKVTLSQIAKNLFRRRKWI